MPLSRRRGGGPEDESDLVEEEGEEEEEEVLELSFGGWKYWNGFLGRWGLDFFLS